LSRSGFSNTLLRLFGKTSSLGLLELGCCGGGFIGTLLHLLKDSGVVSITGVDWSRDLGKQFKAAVVLRWINSSFVESDLLLPIYVLAYSNIVLLLVVNKSSIFLAQSLNAFVIYAISPAGLVAK
jgi:hypothetical protein